MVSSNLHKKSERPQHVTKMPASATASGSTAPVACSNLMRRTAALVSAVALATSSSLPANASLVGPTAVMAFSLNSRISASSGRGRLNHDINNVGGAFGGRQIGATSFISQRSSGRRHVVARKYISARSTSSLSMIAKSGGKEILTTEQFEVEVLSPDLTERPVLVFYSAPWCGPCRLVRARSNAFFCTSSLSFSDTGIELCLWYLTAKILLNLYR
jgi:thiol-disulfide isomerase/thioredoxin